MGAGLPQLYRLLIEFAGASTRTGHKAASHGFDSLLAVWVQEEDDGVPLCVVKSVHGFRSHIKKSVTVLRKNAMALLGVMFFSKSCYLLLYHTCSMICLMVFSLTTPEDFSLPASFGSVSER